MKILLLPPIAFLLMLVFVRILDVLFKKYAFKGIDEPGQDKTYACGEDAVDPGFEPEYSQFFSFAFFFTIMHVAALVVASAPPGRLTMLEGALYITGAVTALLILFRR